MNGHSFWVALALGIAGFTAGIIWGLHANDAGQTARLDELDRRAAMARQVLDGWGEQLEEVRRDLALLKQRVDGRP